MNPAAMSLADKIGLTLQGAASWQQLQNIVAGPAGMENLEISPESDEVDAEIGESEVDPAVLAAKTKLDKKMERFRKSVEDDAGKILETIVLDTIVPVPEKVAWDQDPELVCCYNWQGPANKEDRTNAIFGECIA
jgi:hypothetical protein